MKISDLLPNQHSCSTRMISHDLYECRVKRPRCEYCSHSVSSGDGFLCRHPDRRVYATGEETLLSFHVSSQVIPYPPSTSC